MLLLLEQVYLLGLLLIANRHFFTVRLAVLKFIHYCLWIQLEPLRLRVHEDAWQFLRFGWCVEG